MGGLTGRIRVTLSQYAEAPTAGGSVVGAGPHGKLPSNPWTQPRNCRSYRGEAWAWVIAGVDIGIVYGTADVVVVGEHHTWYRTGRGCGREDGGGLMTVGSWYGLRNLLSAIVLWHQIKRHALVGYVTYRHGWNVGNE
jgi:hypothetical protein